MLNFDSQVLRFIVKGLEWGKLEKSEYDCESRTARQSIGTGHLGSG
jgi:hypothetical protein